MTYRQLTKEQRYVWLAEYQGKVQVVDDYGRNTGEWVASYGNPVRHICTLSPNSGNATSNGFGLNVACDRTCKLAYVGTGIDPTWIAWVDVTPELNDDGSLKVDGDGLPTVPNDYIITMVAESYEITNLSLKRSS